MEKENILKTAVLVLFVLTVIWMKKYVQRISKTRSEKSAAKQEYFFQVTCVEESGQKHEVFNDMCLNIKA